MNLDQFKTLIGDHSYPVELAYGYTFDRDSLHIILYEDRISRIVVAFNGDIVSRIDQSDNIKIDTIINPHKRFYPNRVNRELVDLCDAFGLYVSITNVDANSDPKFEF